jgi:hypothetical protein
MVAIVFLFPPAFPLFRIPKSLNMDFAKVSIHGTVGIVWLFMERERFQREFGTMEIKKSG